MTKEETMTLSVAEFIKVFDASLDFKVWYKMVQEEFAELLAEEPKTAEHLKELTDLAYVLTGYFLTCAITPLELISEKMLAKHTEMGDNLPPIFDKHVEYYSKEVLEEAFRRVHASNMSKLGEDGEPIRREDGKVLKGPNYKPPDLSDLV